MSPVVILVYYVGEVNAATVPDWISLVLNTAVGLVFLSPCLSLVATFSAFVCVGLPLADWGSSDDELDLSEARPSFAGPDGIFYRPLREMSLRALLIVYAGADVLIRETPTDLIEIPTTQHRVILLSNGDHSPNYSRMAGFYISSDAFALTASDVLS